MKNKLSLPIILLLMFSALYLFSYTVPFNMDEFSYYHVLASHYYPLNMLNHFREPSTRFDLAPFGYHYLPLRENFHQGSFSSLLYLPLFLVWPSPYSARLLTLLLLSAQAYCLSRLFRANWVIAYLFILAYMPYAFLHLCDIGPLSFHTTSVILICFLTDRWLKNLGLKNKAGWLYPLTIGLFVFLGVWIKLSYFVVLPGIACLVIYHIVRSRKMFHDPARTITLLRHLVILLAAAIVPSFILFNSRDVTNHRFYEFLFVHAGTIQTTPKLALLQYFIYPLTVTHKVFSVSCAKFPVLSIANAICFLAILLFGLIKLYLKRIPLGFAVLNAGLFVAVLFFISLYPGSWAASHTALSLPFLVLAFFYIASHLRKDRLIQILLIAFLTVNAGAYYHLTKLKYHMNNHPGLLKINATLNDRFARAYVFIVIDWGMYYLQSLYGDKNQCVLYMQPLNSKKQIEAIKKILDTTRRKALFIGRASSESDLLLIKEQFPSLRTLKTDFDTGDWRVWYESGDSQHDS